MAAGTRTSFMPPPMLKLQFLASQTALFEQSLAPAGYTAAPAAIWPESPAAEAMVGVR